MYLVYYLLRLCTHSQNVLESFVSEDNFREGIDNFWQIRLEILIKNLIFYTLYTLLHILLACAL